ncbi:MAG: hypothetical protein KDI50_00640 [Candidatus Competibacteraceae bacterium]|nr:hypothetical protein [Candidatus Competibacteraceae bacterium]
MKARYVPVLITMGLMTCVGVQARGGHGPGDGTSTATTATISTTAVSIDESATCQGGGTRAISGSYDPTTGVLESTMSYSSCIERDSTQDGSITTTGTLVQDSSDSTVYALDMSTVTDITRTRGTDESQMTCTRTAVGTYDLTAQTFTGTVTQESCVDEMVATQYGDIVQQLLSGHMDGHH